MEGPWGSGTAQGDMEWSLGTRIRHMAAVNDLDA